MWFDSFTSTSVFSAACLVAKFFEDLTKVTYQEPVNYSNWLSKLKPFPQAAKSAMTMAKADATPSWQIPGGWWVTQTLSTLCSKNPCRRFAGSKHATVLLQLHGLGHIWVTLASNCRWARPVEQAVGSRRWAGWTQPCRVCKLEGDASGCKTCRPTAAMEFRKQEDRNGKTVATCCKYELQMAFECVWWIRVPLEVGCFIWVDESPGSISCDSSKKDHGSATYGSSCSL